MAFACAFSALGDFQLAEDAAQEAFISAWQRLNQLREPEAFPGWLRRIVLTACNRLTRAQRMSLTTLDEGKVVPSMLENQQTAVEKNELKHALPAAKVVCCRRQAARRCGGHQHELLPLAP